MTYLSWFHNSVRKDSFDFLNKFVEYYFITMKMIWFRWTFRFNCLIWFGIFVDVCHIPTPLAIFDDENLIIVEILYQYYPKYNYCNVNINAVLLLVAQ